MIVAGQLAAANSRDEGTRPRLHRAVDDRGDARMHQRPHAHQTWLDRHAQRRTGEPRASLKTTRNGKTEQREGLAERVGFEPTCRLPDKTLSRRPRYDHFGTSPVGR